MPGAGWEGMGREEKELLGLVAEVAEMYKVSLPVEKEGFGSELMSAQVFIAATYLLPTSPSRHLLNVVTLVGPSSTPGSPPNIIWSTTKQHPVPIIEDFTHISRTDLSLGSLPNHLPLSTIRLPHLPHTPSPHLTPLQPLAITSATCLDIAFPTLLTSFVVPLSSPSHPRTAQLVLNPSSAPEGLAQVQWEQAAARAWEGRAFVLRCDTRDGISGLVGPDGRTRVLRGGEEGWGSWEGEMDAERAEGRTWFGAMGSQWAVWAALLGVVCVVLGLEQMGAVLGRIEMAQNVVGRVKRWTTLAGTKRLEAERLLVDIA